MSCKQSAESLNNSFELGPLLDQYSKEYYKLHPLSATANGVNDYNDRLEMNLTQEYVEQSIKFNQKYLDTLSKIDFNQLEQSERLTMDVLKYRLETTINGLNAKLGFYRPVDQFVFSFPQRFATLGSGTGYIPFKTLQDYQNFISRMEAFALWVDQAILNMETGLELGNSNPKAAMLKVPDQLKPLFEGDTRNNIFYKPLLNLPEYLDSLTAEKLRIEYTSAIENIVKPTYKKLHDYLVLEYIPSARESTGLLDNANGESEYQLWLEYYTTTDITADEIFELGLSEVARIRSEMDSLKQSIGFVGDLNAFFKYVKTDPKFFPFKTEKEVLDRYRSFEERMSPQLDKLFNLRPKAGFEIRATEKFREAGANAQYMRASRDGTRPGVFYETVRNPLKYNYIDMESLFIHEAIPGHHYQIAIQQEADISEFQKSYALSAFGEGWALYAESLGQQLGMYTDPYQYLGRLNNEMERAVRLVVDTGMHHKGWSREKAIDYVLANQPVTALVAEQRIERYMVTPGQAVSYKVGEQKIISLRDKAKKQLGDKFDIKEFHDKVLEDGRLPLLILEQKIDHWIKSKSL